MNRKRLALFAISLIIGLILGYLLAEMIKPMSYVQVVSYAARTGYRPATFWELEHLDHRQLMRLKMNGHDYPWLFVRQ